MKFTAYASSSSGNLYTVSDGRSTLLLECGIPFKKLEKKLDYKLSNISGICLTHAHRDHSEAAVDCMKAGIDLYCSQGCATERGLSGHRLNIVKDGDWQTIGSFCVFFYDSIHDTPEPLMFLIHSTATKENLLFVTDSVYVPNRFPNLNYICIEANYSKEILDYNIQKGVLPASLRNRIVGSHMSIDTLIGMLRANDLSKIKDIYLLHLSSGNSDAEDFRKQVQQETGIPTFIA